MLLDHVDGRADGHGAVLVGRVHRRVLAAYAVDDFVDLLALVRAVEQPAAMTDYEPLGSGQSYTVKEYLDAHRSKYGKLFDVEIGERREGDLPRSEVPFVSEFMTPTKTLEEIV